MYIFEIVIVLLLCGALLSALARRVGIPYPALVALAGAALAMAPGTPVLQLDPELALALFVAPVLLDAAFDSSPRDLRRNWIPVAGLAIGAVALTIACVALAVRFLVPGMPLSVAIALGAIVAPPDAAAATAVLKQLRPPYRLLVILEGESLFNDASALLVYRMAVAAAIGASAVGWKSGIALLGVTVGSCVLGYVLSKCSLLLLSHVKEITTAVIFQFCTTFAVWLIAERLHLSGILTTVAYAMIAARTASDITPARIRIPSYAVWEVVTYILNVLAFILIGLQLRPILARLSSAELRQYIWVAIGACLAVIVARLVWVMAVASWSVWRCEAHLHRQPTEADSIAISPRAAALVGWCGMRGIVTLASALALPAATDTSPEFPYRGLILFTAFSVVLGTLVVQGLTLRPIMRRLQLSDDGQVDGEIRLARLAVLEAGLAATDGAPASETLRLIRGRYQLELSRAQEEASNAGSGSGAAGTGGAPQSALPEASHVVAAMQAERQKLSALRAAGTIGDAAFQRIEQDLDWRELDLQQWLHLDEVSS